MGGVVKKVMFLGKATTFVVGLAVILALSAGVASSALAGTGVGATFNLGKTNSVNALSSLVGSTASSMIKVDNNGTGVAIDLQVGPSTTPPDQKAAAPMRVDSQALVTNLNADKIDGRDAADLEGLSDVRTRSVDVFTKAGANGFGTARCADGEVATGGGVDMLSGSASKIHYFEPGGRPLGDPPVAWDASWFAGADTLVRVHVVCAS
jgi:hypothetical protein